MITSPIDTRIDSVAPRLRWDVLAPPAIDRVHEATLTLLEDVGVRFPGETALGVLEGAGCPVDRGTQTVRLPRRVVLEALATAPRDFVLAGREPERDLRIDLRHCYLGNGGRAAAVLDPVDGNVRPSAKADVAAAARFVDGLPAFACCRGPAVTGLDAPPATRALHDAEAVLTATTKHFQAIDTAGRRQACYLIEMAAAVVGGERELSRRPIVSFVQSAAGPLVFQDPTLAAAMVAAGHGLPVGFRVAAPEAAGGPSRLAARLVVCFATALAGIVLLQVVEPGAPCFLGVETGGAVTLDGRDAGALSRYCLAAAGAQLARFYGLPVSVGISTAAVRPGWQAAAIESLSTITAVMGWADMIHGDGRGGGSSVLRYPGLVLEAEIWSIVRKMAAGIEVDQGTLALETIAAVGPGGTFLGEKHTRSHRKDVWRPTVWDRRPRDVWLREGRPDAWEDARVIADGLLADHRPPLLSDEVAAGLRVIVEHADKELVTS